MKWSRYTLPCCAPDGTLVVCNLQTGVIAELEPDELLEMGDELLGDLKGCGFVVENEEDETWNSFALIKKRANDPTKLIILLAPTMACNNLCYYCYEPGDIKCGKPMSDETINLFCLALDDCMRQNNFEVLSLEFIGGEPLLGWRVIKKLLPRVKVTCQQYGVRLEVEMTSNGQLLTPTKARFLCRYNWQNLQVTLEGTKGVHDLIRHTRGGRETFEKIIANLKALIANNCAPEEITIRVHVDPKNQSDTKNLLQFLLGEGLATDSRFLIRLAVVNASLANKSEGLPVYNPNIAEMFLDLFAFMRERGIRGVPEIYSFGPVCYKRRRWSFIVDPFGNLYDCESLLGQLEHATGHISDGLVRKNPDLFFDRLPEECRECQFLPVCAGACPYYAMVQPKNSCPRDFLETIHKKLFF